MSNHFITLTRALTADEKKYSYLTQADHNLIVEQVLPDENLQAYALTTDDQKVNFITAATQRIDRENFIGYRTLDNQILEWPREGAKKPNSYAGNYVSPWRKTENQQGDETITYVSGANQGYFDADEIPDQIKRATLYLAVFFSNNLDALGETGLEGFENIKIGSLDVTPRFFKADEDMPPMTHKYLNGLRTTSAANISVKRS